MNTNRKARRAQKAQDRRQQEATATNPGLDAIFKEICKAAEADINGALEEMVERGITSTHGLCVVSRDSGLLAPQPQLVFSEAPVVMLMTRRLIDEEIMKASEGADKSLAESVQPDSVPVMVCGREATWFFVVDAVQTPSLESAYAELDETLFADACSALADVRSALMMISAIDIDTLDMEEGEHRERMRSFQTAARSAYERERQEPTPRPFDQFLYEEFNGKEIEVRVLEGDIRGAMDIICPPLK